MTYYIEHISDTIGQNYIGLSFTPEATTYLNTLKEITSESDYKLFTDNQQKRDKGKFHITVLNVAEYNSLSKEMGIDKFINSLDLVFKYPIDDLKMLGVGTESRNENKAYFIVCSSSKLEALRNRYNLPNKDFHITLGFNPRDVFGVRKNIVMEKSSSFLKLLGQEFFKKNNWNFVRNIENFNLDTKEEIVPIKLTDTTLKLKCDGYFIDIIYIENDKKFWVATKYSINEDLPRLPETEILRKFKNKNEN
jgi:hypothetical protein